MPFIADEGLEHTSAVPQHSSGAAQSFTPVVAQEAERKATGTILITTSF